MGLEQVCGRLDTLGRAREIIGEQCLEPQRAQRMRSGEQCLEPQRAQRMRSAPENVSNYLTKASSATPRKIQSFAKTIIYDAAAVPKAFPCSNKQVSQMGPTHLDGVQPPQACLPPSLKLQAQPQVQTHGTRFVLQQPYSDGRQSLSASIAQSTSIPMVSVVSNQTGILHHSMDDGSIPQKRHTVNHQVAALISPLPHFRSIPRM